MSKINLKTHSGAEGVRDNKKMKSCAQNPFVKNENENTRKVPAKAYRKSTTICLLELVFGDEEVMVTDTGHHHTLGKGDHA